MLHPVMIRKLGGFQQRFSDLQQIDLSPTQSVHRVQIRGSGCGDSAVVLQTDLGLEMGFTWCQSRLNTQADQHHYEAPFEFAVDSRSFLGGLSLGLDLLGPGLVPGLSWVCFGLVLDLVGVDLSHVLVLSWTWSVLIWSQSGLS